MSRSIFILLSAGLVLVGMIILVNSLIFFAMAERAPGTILEMVERQTDEGVTYAPKFEFQDINNRRVVVTANSGSDIWNLSAGDEITVLYRPSNPSGAKISSLMGLWVLPLVLIFMGVSMYFAALRARN